jgi:hypothetical protein
MQTDNGSDVAMEVVAKISSPKVGGAIEEVAPKSTPASTTTSVPSELTTPTQSE